MAGAVTEGLKEFDGVAAVSEPSQNEAGDLTVVSVTPTSGPTTQETRDLVTALRDKADEVNAASGIDAYVTGQTAVNIDTADRLNASLIKYILVVVGLALILLTIVFRSILVPIKAAAGFLLSIAASLGLVVWIFQDGNLADVFGVAQTGPILSFLPILLIGILFGLAMDYEVFLVSRMREHFTQDGQGQGVRDHRLRPERPRGDGRRDHHDRASSRRSSSPRARSPSRSACHSPSASWPTHSSSA